jgi:hypothetical protein
VHDDLQVPDRVPRHRQRLAGLRGVGPGFRQPGLVAAQAVERRTGWRQRQDHHVGAGFLDAHDLDEVAAQVGVRVPDRPEARRGP